MRWFVAFVVALLVVTVLGTGASTHFVLEALETTGTEIPWADRLPSFGQDLLGLGPTYAGVVTPALLLFLGAGTRLLRAAPFPPLLVMPTAGALALLATMLLLPMVFGIMPISGARSGDGIAAQMCAGIVGGLAFALVRGGALVMPPYPIPGSPR